MAQKTENFTLGKPSKRGLVKGLWSVTDIFGVA